MNDPVKHIALVCNPTFENEKALKASELVKELLTIRGIPFTFFLEKWPGTLDGFSDAWIFGGDGTVNYFINNYRHLHLPLSVFKGGSGNDTHWMLYGDTTHEAQVNQILKGNTTWVDAGICNGSFFLNGVGLGFDGAIVKDLLGKKKLGKASYMLSVLKNIVGFREKDCEIIVDEDLMQDEYLMISVANGQRYGGGFMVTPKALYNDGMLDVAMVARIPPLKRMKYLPFLEKGEHLHLPFVSYKQGGQIKITSFEEIPAHLDGEFMSAREFNIACLPKKYLFSV